MHDLIEVLKDLGVDVGRPAERGRRALTLQEWGVRASDLRLFGEYCATHGKVKPAAILVSIMESTDGQKGLEDCVDVVTRWAKHRTGHEPNMPRRGESYKPGEHPELADFDAESERTREYYRKKYNEGQIEP